MALARGYAMGRHRLALVNTKLLLCLLLLLSFNY